MVRTMLLGSGIRGKGPGNLKSLETTLAFGGLEITAKQELRRLPVKGWNEIYQNKLLEKRGPESI